MRPPGRRFRLEPDEDQDPVEFAAAASQSMKGTLVRCEERYPDAGSHSILYLVVEGNVERCRQKLSSLHEQYFARGLGDPLAPVQLEVVDRATDETVQRLVEVGLLARTVRACRTLWPLGNAAARELSPAELRHISEMRERAARKLKVVRVLQEAALDDEARGALLDALPLLGRALAIERGWPEPADLHETLLPPVSSVWKEALPGLRHFSTEGCPPCPHLLDALAGLLQTNSATGSA